jgi:hypothetical protein
MAFIKNGLIFAFGGVAYGLIEVLVRQETHWSMLIAGGLCFLVIGAINAAFPRLPLLAKTVVFSGLVTTVEFSFGWVFNMRLGMRVWDYSHMPLNLYGQVCLPFIGLWALLGLAAIPIHGYLFSRLCREQFRRKKTSSTKMAIDRFQERSTADAKN